MDRLSTGRVRQLSAGQTETLSRQGFTYEPVGATRGPSYPEGFHHLRTDALIGHGDAAFRTASEALMTWRMHAGAGLRVAASSSRVHEGAVVVCRLGPLRIPCRVLWVVDDPDARGFGYGTLPGHPEAGEEAFVLTRQGDDVRLTVSAYSRPGLLLTRLAGPVGRLGQRVMLRRYAATLRRQI
jgi:uncharacterized protein (UPF0548 family)